MPGTKIETTVVAYLDVEDNPDITNPIHSTEVAKAYGFAGPLVGGVTVWGWATDTILEALGEDWLEGRLGRVFIPATDISGRHSDHQSCAEYRLTVRFLGCGNDQPV